MTSTEVGVLLVVRDSVVCLECVDIVMFEACWLPYDSIYSVLDALEGYKEVISFTANPTLRRYIKQEPCF
jgi:hypothetical protein